MFWVFGSLLNPQYLRQVMGLPVRALGFIVLSFLMMHARRVCGACAKLGKLSVKF